MGKAGPQPQHEDDFKTEAGFVDILWFGVDGIAKHDCLQDGAKRRGQPRQLSIADIMFNFPKMTWPASARRHASPWARKTSATSNAGQGMIPPDHVARSSSEQRPSNGLWDEGEVVEETGSG